MLKTDFGDMKFNVGFKKSDSVAFCGEDKEITIKLKAYYEKDGITDEQKDALKRYYDQKEQYDELATELAVKYDKGAKDRFIPKTLLIDRVGQCALLCDDIEEPDEGIAICLFPENIIVSQDDYL